MAKVSFRSDAAAPIVDTPSGAIGQIESRAIFDGAQNPIHLHSHRLAPGARLGFQPSQNERLVYVWNGVVKVGAKILEAGSSAIAESGANLEVAAESTGAVLLAFTAVQRGPTTRSGGHVHLLPHDRVPRVVRAPRVNGLVIEKKVGSSLHANSQCPTCHVWLHENDFFGPDEVTDVHSHSADEIIFVRSGSVRFGKTFYGPGSAVAIAANTKYGFTSGPDGLGFLNFRAGPSTYTSLDGSIVIDEATVMTEMVGRPEYIS